jgi:opacity protein-like surface antigen
MKIRLMLICCLAVFVSEARCDQGFYLTVSGGYLFGNYGAAVADLAVANAAVSQTINAGNPTPLTLNGIDNLFKHRDEFSPSIAVGYRLWDPVGIEISYTGDGRYDYEYVYGYVTPVTVPPATSMEAATAPVFLHEKLYDVALRVPIRVTLNNDVVIELVPGLARQELQMTYSYVALSAVDSSLIHSPLYSKNSGRWAIEGGLRASWTFNPTFALVVGYRYTSASAKQISLVSLGLTARY